MFKGVVKMTSDRGYLFIKRDDGLGGDVFCHMSTVSRAGICPLEKGDHVQFNLAPGRNGKTEAKDIVLLDEKATP